MMKLKNGQHYRNYGRIDPNRNVFRLALCDRYGHPLLYYKGYWNPKRGTYRCYPDKVAVPGMYDFDVITLGMMDVSGK